MYDGIWVLPGEVIVGCEGNEKRETQKDAFRRGGPRAVIYVHYFNDIRQVALQFDCVMFFVKERGICSLFQGHSPGGATV